ncbi:D-alanyl-D-alanine carboxypeptidase [Aequitasia blattaphilus]|uniref:Serine hydrolase n=1 Tax=Aequitasia blattaphilus TaxID=2949332 RepID=A0ABT1EC05_9FIRM|nr:serine hydrolase [Aequitasia blattaphilus]MCP1102366.1 serine hydrolase [Aequitasia blattaphilus]MCR8615006.1 serine hydrolase [Aequitasia blattaphilus]
MFRTIKKVGIFLLAASFFVMPVNAQVLDGETEEGTLEELMEKGKKIPIETNELKEWPKAPETNGRAAIVMEAGTGAILYAKNINEQLYPASITKVLTALVAFENSSLTDEVEVSADSVSCVEAGYAHIGLKEGNKITVEQALYATLLASANEAAYSVAESIGKEKGYDYEWFIEQMNGKCKEIGANDSNFVNPNGIQDPEHYTTAKDMALIGRELFAYPEFFKICQTLNYKIPASDTVEEHVFQQMDAMLIPEAEQYYDKVIAGKTGYTDSSRSTLVTMATDGEMDLVCVVLHTYGVNSQSDTKNILEYVFSNFEKVETSEFDQSKDYDALLEEDKGYVVVPKNFDVSKLNSTIIQDKENPGQASVSYTYKDNPVGSVGVSLSKEYTKRQRHLEESGQEKSDIVTLLKEKKKALPIPYMIAGGVIVLGLILYFGILNKRKRQRKRLRRRRRR